MTCFAENLRKMQQGNRPTMPEQPIFSAVVVGITGSRYLVNDGTHTLEVEAGVSDSLAVNDRVWCARGRATCVIIGTAAANRETGTI